MDETRDLVQRAARGDEADRLAAFGELVRRYQDMAYGYAWSILADFHLAEDAAQDAFVTAYGRLAQLRDPAAFAGWLRRIVHSACHRILRRPRRETAPLEAASTVAVEGETPDVHAETNERRDEVAAAIEGLPDPQREVTTLFYIDGYSQRDVADFLEVPVTTVNNRLHASRERLRERMLTMVADELKKRPLSDGFPERIRMLLELPRPLEEPGHPVRALWDAFRAAFPDHEVVELDEVCDPAIWLEAQRNPHGAFVIDERRMLRTELTSQLLDRWLAEGGGPVKWITAGRVFREEEPSSRLLQVFHQAEVLEVGEGLVEADCDRAVLRAAERLIPGLPFERGGRVSYVPTSNATVWGSPCGDGDLMIAGGGLFDEEWVAKGGLDPKRYGAIGFAFGLERTAQIKLGLDDVRQVGA